MCVNDVLMGHQFGNFQIIKILIKNRFACTDCLIVFFFMFYGVLIIHEMPIFFGMYWHQHRGIYCPEL